MTDDAQAAPAETKQERRRRKAGERDARYQRTRRAEAEVLRRVGLALDRLSVATGGNNPAQFVHAVHYLQRGLVGGRERPPDDAPDFGLGQREAEELALALHSMLTLARNAKWTYDEMEAADLG